MPPKKRVGMVKSIHFHLFRMDSMAMACSALKKGQFVILHDSDGRENESDLLLIAEKAYLQT